MKSLLIKIVVLAVLFPLLPKHASSQSCISDVKQYTAGNLVLRSTGGTLDLIAYYDGNTTPSNPPVGQVQNYTITANLKYSNSSTSYNVTYSISMDRIYVTIPRNPASGTVTGTLTMTFYNPNNYSCREVRSTITFTHYGTISPGSIGSNQTIGSGSQPALLTSSTSAVNHTSYQWEQSANNSTWTSVSGATAATYQPGSLTATTYYRRRAYTSLESAYSNVVTITVTTGAGKTFVPTQTQNYILSSAPFEALSIAQANILNTGKAVASVIYYDGLGRPMQEVSVNGSLNDYDIVRPVVYNAYGREEKTYLPYQRSGTQGIYTDNTSAVTAQRTFYSTLHGATDAPYTFVQKQFEASPLSRVMKEAAPGKDWNLTNGQPTEFTYTTDSANEVKFWKVSGATLSHGNVYYAAGELYVTEVKDPEGMIVREFTDKLGNMVEKRQKNGTSELVTSYVYDANNRLLAVIPPKAQTIPSDFDKLVYRYTYDNYGRLIEKKLPDSDIHLMVYDNRDRLVMEQDGEQRQAGQWTMILYDNVNRPVVTGVVTTALAHGTLRSYFNTAHVNQTRSNDNYTLNTVSGVPALPATNVLSYTYYDSYGGNPHAYTASHFKESAPVNLTTVKGQASWTKVKVLDGNELTASAKWLSAATFYDNKYRPVQVRRHLYDAANNGTASISTNFAFDGNPVNVREVQTFNGVTTTVDMGYTYDHIRRPLETRMDGTLIARYEYDALGRMKTKTLGNNEVVTYAYNIRDWLTQTSSSKFKSTLTYFLNGNIKRQQSQNNGTALDYNYAYDGYGRLISGMAGTIGEQNIAYDANGNFLTLWRNTGAQTYGYDGNRMTSFSVGSQNYTYEYNQNGSVKTDGYRGVSITYNVLNLPRKITKGTNSLEYIYSATGEKLAKKVSTGFTQFYAGSMVYNGSKTLEYVLHSEGMARKNGTTYSQQYNLTDHLGNVRTVLSNTGAVIQANDYYPFGKTHATTVANLANNKYLYNGKELQDGLSGFEQLDYGARFYDPVTGRWSAVDPLAEQSRRFSPYVYCYNNPLRFVDPDGMLADWYLNEQNGELYFNKNIDSETTTHNDEQYVRVGDNNMMGDMGDVEKKTYNSDESQQIANENGYSIEPTQQLIHETSHHSSLSTWNRNINTKNTTNISINEKYSIVKSQSSASLQNTTILNRTSKIKLLRNTTTIVTVKRNNLNYNKTSNKTVNSLIDFTYNFLNNVMSNYESTSTVIYKSWNEYTQKTNDKLNLLIYMQ